MDFMPCLVKLKTHRRLLQANGKWYFLGKYSCIVHFCIFMLVFLLKVDLLRNAFSPQVSSICECHWHWIIGAAANWCNSASCRFNSPHSKRCKTLTATQSLMLILNCTDLQKFGNSYEVCLSLIHI